MKHILAVGLVWLLSLPAWGTGTASGQGSRKLLTVWLIPVELADTDQTMNFDEFNSKVSEGGWVTVLNTTIPHYRDQLIAWNPEFAYPNFPIIKGQRETIKALRRFAQGNGIHINVRFVWWGQTFDELKAITEGKQSPMQDGTQIAPDVVQTGSTWVGYFAKKGTILPRGSEPDGLDWRDTPDVVAASLRYTTDLHLIFYWKRMSWPVSGSPFLLESNSWDAILDSLSKRPIAPGRLNPPMAMPIALTYRILHDYAPLIWAGGGDLIDKNSREVDLTSDSALAIPRKLMERSVQVGEQNGRHSLLAFPEMSHEEAVQHFLNGEYLAVIEPVHFFKRWRDAVTGNGLPKGFTADQKGVPKSVPVNFWDYAGVAAPPRTFIGGSDLIVTNRVKDKTEEKELAFKLVRFLATDDSYSATLAEIGTLPAQRQQFGIDILRTALRVKPDSASNSNDEDGSTEFAIALSLALSRRSEQEYPAIAEWPEYFESREVLEAIQRIWRRIGEGGTGENAKENLKVAAADAERMINRNFNWRIRLWEDIERQWPIVVGLLIFLVTLLGGFLWVQIGKTRERGKRIQAQAEVIIEREERIQAQAEAIQAREQEIQALEQAANAEKERAKVVDEWAKALDQVRKVRGFTSAALLIVYEVHNILNNKYRRPDEKDREKAEKALVLITGIQGWRRGRDDRNWIDTPLEKVIWSAIILAIESTYTAQLFKDWEQEGYPNAQTFLKRKGLIRDKADRELSEARGGSDECPPFYFDVDCPTAREIPMPLMLEQALVSLLQNAIKASRHKKYGYHPITISYDAASDAVYVSNEGPPLSAELCAVLNDSKDLDEFERRIDELLISPGDSKPGVGLVEAYSIATQCYGGMKVDTHQPKVSILL